MPDYTTRINREPPRLPLEGSIDLTYRCNNNCRHCWLWEAEHSAVQQQELSFDEIKGIVDAARQMGTRKWSISGGEPMLRPDFSEIFDYITRKSSTYSLNTNGTLITPAIAELMKRKGDKMVALYGATAEVHDRVTRSPGSFEATMQGFATLKEAGANFTVQIVPMRDNYHQYAEMEKLAQTLSPAYRVGASWLNLSASGSAQRNVQIAEQRLDPLDAFNLDQPDLAYDEWAAGEIEPGCAHNPPDDRLFASCIEMRRDFHIDPYGMMSFCSYIKNPDLRYDLRRGTFREAWEDFIPSLADKVHGGSEYEEKCGSCDLRSDCRWCAVYGYLEHGRYSAGVEYLCAIAREKRRYKEAWEKDHRRYYRVAGVTIQIDSDLPFTPTTYDPIFDRWRVDKAGDDTISIQHSFSLPDLDRQKLGKPVYHRTPWAIYRKGNSWIYLGISDRDSKHLNMVAVFSQDHSRSHFYIPSAEPFLQGNMGSLAFLPTDQILLARVLANRQGCFLHSSGVILNGQGLLFVGHSEAGKSTTVKMLQDQAEILSDDRNIVRRWPEGFMLHGNWSHGEIALVSPASAPLKAIFFLRQAKENSLQPMSDRRLIRSKLLACLIKPFVTVDWWEKNLSLIEIMAREVPCYEMHFDRSGKVVKLLQDLVA